MKTHSLAMVSLVVASMLAAVGCSQEETKRPAQAANPRPLPRPIRDVLPKPTERSIEMLQGWPLDSDTGGARRRSLADLKIDYGAAPKREGSTPVSERAGRESFEPPVTAAGGSDPLRSRGVETSGSTNSGASRQELETARKVFEQAVVVKFTGWQEKPDDLWVVLREALVRDKAFRNLALQTREQKGGVQIRWDFRPEGDKFKMLQHSAKGEVVATVCAMEYVQDANNKYVHHAKPRFGGKVLLSNRSGAWQVRTISQVVPAEELSKLDL
jgi:hypothetical protein